MKNIGFVQRITIYHSEYDTETDREYFKNIDAYDALSKKDICYIPSVEFESADVDTFTDTDVMTYGIGYCRDDFEEMVFSHIEDIADELNEIPSFYGVYKAKFVANYSKNLFLSLHGECPETKLDEIDADDLLNAYLDWVGDLQ